MMTACCRTMADNLAQTCDQHPNRFDCPDVVMERFDTDPPQYGLPVHDGGASIIAISFCPWCGTHLGTARTPSSGDWIRDACARASERLAALPASARPRWTRGPFGDRPRRAERRIEQ